MAELLKRIVRSTITNVVLADLGIKLRNIGDSLDLLSQRSFNQIMASKSLDEAISAGWVELIDESGDILSTVNAFRGSNFATLKDTLAVSGDFPALSDIADNSITTADQTFQLNSGTKTIFSDIASEVILDLDESTKEIGVGGIVQRKDPGTDAPLIIKPKGTGAFQIDDGGDTRGISAADLQSVRISSDQVASGDYSFIAGGKLNKASGSFSHAEGNNTTASGAGSHVEGAYSTASGLVSHAEGVSTVSSGGFGSHAEGYATTADGKGSHAEGFYSYAFGPQSHAEGHTTVASGEASHAEGRDTEATAKQAHSEGYYTTASGNYSHASGLHGEAKFRAQYAQGNGSSTASHQYGRLILRNTTTNATITELTLDGAVVGASNVFTITNDRTIGFTIEILGRRNTGAESARFIRDGIIQKTGIGDVSLVGSINATLDQNSTTWSVSITAEISNQTLSVKVTGAVGSTINWVAIIKFSEVLAT